MSGHALTLSARKELQSLLPIWTGCAALLVLADVFQIPLGRQYLLLVFALASIALGAHAIGQEFANGTFVLTMTLPTARRNLLVVKLAMVAVLLVALSGIGWWTLPQAQTSDFVSNATLIGLLALCVAPAWTLIARSTLAGAVFTIATPAIIRLVLDVIGAWRFDRNPARMDAFQDEVFAPVLLVVYAIAAVATARMFAALEADDTRGREFHFFSRDPSTRAARSAGSRRHPLGQLVAKELRIQQMTLTITAIFAIGVVVQVVVLQVYPDSPTWHVMPVAMIHGLAGAILAGSLASAEERQLGTWHAQLMLPVRPALQWAVKAGVAYALVVVLAFGLTLAAAYLLPGTFGSGTRRLLPLGLLLVVASLALYVSSLSQSGIRALLTVVLVLFGFVPLGNSLVRQVPRLLAKVIDTPATGLTGPLGARNGGQIAAGMMVIFCLATVWLGYRNHRSGDQRAAAVVVQAFALAFMVLAFVVAGFIVGV